MTDNPTESVPPMPEQPFDDPLSSASDPDDEQLRRIFNLALALNKAHVDGAPIPSDYIRDYLALYAGRTKKAFDKIFKEDLEKLKEIGFDVSSTIQPGSSCKAYTVRARDTFLDAINYTPAEANIVAQTMQMGMSESLTRFARTGWRKIAAAGADRPLDVTPIGAVLGDLRNTDIDTVAVILRAAQEKKVVTFAYRKIPTASPTFRSLEPWALVPHKSRLYLVGFDRDRDAIRTFRITRISDVHVSDEEDLVIHERVTDAAKLREIVRQSFSFYDQGAVTATVTITPGTGGELTGLPGAKHVEGDVWEISGLTRRELVGKLAYLAPDVLCTGPEDLRHTVRDFLLEADAAQTTSADMVGGSGRALEERALSAADLPELPEGEQ